MRTNEQFAHYALGVRRGELYLARKQMQGVL
jgi:hypothetical protein